MSKPDKSLTDQKKKLYHTFMSNLKKVESQNRKNILQHLIKFMLKFELIQTTNIQ